MNIPELSMALSQTAALSDVGTAMLSKSLDSLESTGDQLTDMMRTSMELSVNPAIGANIDTFV